MKEEKNMSDINNNYSEVKEVEKVIDMTGKKYCKHCGKVIDQDVVVCIHCGKQVEELKSASQPNIVINNENANANTNTSTNTNNNNNYAQRSGGKEKNKWVALILCFFFGALGVHRFYEGKVLTGILWMCTLGLLGFGVLIDFLIIAFKPNPYYV